MKLELIHENNIIIEKFTYKSSDYYKNDIVNRAKMIGTYETSILPYQDCCSFFIPNHPETKAKIDIIKKFDSKLNIEKLLQESIDNAELKEFSFKENIK